MPTTPGVLAAPTRTRLVNGVTIGLLLLGSAYVAKGTHAMFASAGDFRMRWTEQHYVFRGKDPVSVYERNDAVRQGRPIDPEVERATLEPDLGVTYGAYPPWAYVTGILFTWPPRYELARVLFGCTNLGLLVFLLRRAYALGTSQSRQRALLFAASILATGSICTTFGLGQYGVLVLAALWGCKLCEEKGQWIGSGVLLAVAMTKITLAAPFFIPLFLIGRIKTLSVASAYLALASGVIWVLVDKDPATLLIHMFHGAEHFAENGYSLVDALVELGFPTRRAMTVAAPATVAVAAAASYVWRRAPLDVHWAIAATASRLWTYHQLNDNLIELFLLYAFGVRAHQHRGHLLGFLVVGLTLWIPPRFCDYAIVREVQIAVWLGSTALLLWLTPRDAMVADRVTAPAVAA